MRCFFGICFVIILINSGSALYCATCKGSACYQSDVPMVECSIRHPFPLVATVKSAALTIGTKETQTNYACLLFVYVVEGQPETISQCIVSTAGSDVCSTLRQSYKVKVCFLKKPTSLGIGEETYSDEIDEEDNNGTTTTATTNITTAAPTTTITTITTTPTTTTITTTATTTTAAAAASITTRDDGHGDAEISQMSVGVVVSIVVLYVSFSL